MKKITDKKTLDEKKLAKLEAKKAAKLKKREAAKAKRLKLIEKRKAKVEANKQKRAEKKAKKLAKLEKIKAKKAAVREHKKLMRQKKLERIAKQKAKAKELKLKARAKAKAEKQNAEVRNTGKTSIKIVSDDASIKIVVNSLKDYIKKLAKDNAGLDDKQVKKLEKLGFTFANDAIGFTFTASRKTKASTKKPEVVEPEVVEEVKPVENVSIEDAIDTVVSQDESAALEELANTIEEDDPIETPVGDTYTDDTIATGQPNGFDEDDDDTIDDSRDEDDDDKVDFRREWNNEFGDDGERDENW